MRKLVSVGGSVGGMSRRFVRFFGFPDIFAGERFLHPKYSNPEEITAWKRVPEMHPYQRDLKDMIETTTLDKSNGRCMFTLPTGAGKTRVVVEVLTGYIKNRILEDEDGIYKGVIIWVAHSEELCAQAIDAMKWVWQTHGEGEEPLRIYRHWGDMRLKEMHIYLASSLHTKDREYPEEQPRTPSQFKR